MSDDQAEDWARLLRDVVTQLALASAAHDRCTDALLELARLRERELESRALDLEEQAHRRRWAEAREARELAERAAAEARRWVAWDRAGAVGREVLGSPHAQSVIAAGAGAVVLAIGWAAATWWGAPSPQEGP